MVAGRPDQAVMAIGVPRVCDVWQLFLKLQMQIASKLAKAKCTPAAHKKSADGLQFHSQGLGPAHRTKTKWGNAVTAWDNTKPEKGRQDA